MNNDEKNGGVLHNDFSIYITDNEESKHLSNFIFNYLLCRGIEIFLVCTPCFYYKGKPHENKSRKLEGNLIANKLEDLYNNCIGKKIAFYVAYKSGEDVIVRYTEV